MSIPNRIISEPEFKRRIAARCRLMRGKVFSVTGPGRSGAVASAYASHYLGIAWIPYSRRIALPKHLQPTLLIDTAKHSGRTIRKAFRRIQGEARCLWLYSEPPIVRFFYEGKSHRRVTAKPKRRLTP